MAVANETFDFFLEALEVVLESDNIQDLCKRVVHSENPAFEIRGAHIFVLDSQLKLGRLASYGHAFDEKESLSLWDTSAIGESLRSKIWMFGDGLPETGGFPYFSFPFLAHSGPVGVCIVIIKEKPTEFEFTDENFLALSRLGAFYLQSRLANMRSIQGSKDSSVEDLTPRQIKILNFMSKGMTNAEIATQVLLSESTVRQETIKIYRALGVGNRQESVIQAKALGLIDSEALLAAG